MSLLYAEQQMRPVEIAVFNARAAISNFQRLLQVSADEDLPTDKLLEAARLMDAALALLKIQGEVIKQSEQYCKEYEDSYAGAALGSQNDLFDKTAGGKERG